MPFANPVVGGEDLIRSAIRSPNYVPGVVGWRIAQDGSAEFNNLTVRGTFKTADAGQRIEIGTTAINAIDFYSGNLGETHPSRILASYGSNRDVLDLISGGTAGDGRTFVELNSAPAGGGLANFTVSFTGNDVTLDRDGDFHCFLGATGVARFYGSGGAERFLVDDLGILATGTNNTIDGPLGVTGSMDVAGAVDVHDRLTADAYGLPYGYGGAQFSDRLSIAVNDTATLDPECLTLAGPNCGISLRQRDRGVNDTDRRCVVYADGDELHFWEENTGDLMRIGQFQNVHFPMGMPAISGAAATINTTSWQLGTDPSGAQFKTDVRPLPETGDDNPLWRFDVRRFRWAEELVRNGAEENERLPGGKAGLLADEVALVAPDAVHRYADGSAAGLDTNVVLAYLVDAVQTLNRRYPSEAHR